MNDHRPSHDPLHFRTHPAPMPDPTISFIRLRTTAAASWENRVIPVGKFPAKQVQPYPIFTFCPGIFSHSPCAPHLLPFTPFVKFLAAVLILTRGLVIASWWSWPTLSYISLHFGAAPKHHYIAS